jgi:hypothetical protein
MSLYSRDFAPRVIAIREELAQHGVTDPFFSHTINNELVAQELAERLGAVALQLK